MENLAAPIFPLPKLKYPVENLSHPLSQELRASTAFAHKQLEERLALPGSIRSLAEYRACLLRFYQLYRPIELQFQSFPDWLRIGLALPRRALSARLAADLQALGIAVPEIACAPPASLPLLPEFACALGARYVLEGSALGSQFMLPHLQEVLGQDISGADSFFRGRGTGTGAFWQEFRATIDTFGDSQPKQRPLVAGAAIATFNAIGLWMRP